MKNYVYNIFGTLFLLLSTLPAKAQFYNGTQQSFGKNRIQYDLFEWKYYRFQKYETYFYTGGVDFAKYTAHIAHKEIKQYEAFFDNSYSERIQFIIYNKYNHFKQSNIGLPTGNDDELFGKTAYIGSKVFLYFNGNYSDFNTQIKKGIAQIFVNQHLYGSNWRQVLKNSALLSIPFWYSSGLTSYLGQPNNKTLNTQIYTHFKNEEFKHLNRLNNESATAAGHSLWMYIANTYGASVIPDILYMTRVTQNIEKGFLYVLGMSFDQLIIDWKKYYKTDPDLSHKKQVNYPLKKHRIYSDIQANEQNNQVALVSNQSGQYKIYLFDLSTQKTTKIFQKEYKLDRITDYTYPVVAWHPAGEILAYVTEEKNFLYFNQYNTKTKETTTKSLFNLEKITSMDYSNKGTKVIFSAIYNGKSDLYLYTISGNSQKKLTNDYYNDLSPSFGEDDNHIFFASNRISDTLNSNATLDENFPLKHDIWLLNTAKSPYLLRRVTNTPDLDERKPQSYKNGVTFLRSDKKIKSSIFAQQDSTIALIDTAVHYNYFFNEKPFYPTGNWEDYSIMDETKFFSLEKEKKRYTMIENSWENLSRQKNQSIKDTITLKIEGSNDSRLRLITKTQTPIKESTPKQKIEINNYQFNNEKNKKIKTITTKQEADSLVKDQPLKFPTQRNYNLSFFNDHSNIQLNNNFINGQYQLFTGGPFTSPSLGGFMKLGTTDIFEDYKISGGFRLGGNSNEYFLSYLNRKKRLDKQILIGRTDIKTTDNRYVYKIKSHYANYSVSWPFSEVTSLRGSAGVRNDRIIAKSTDFSSLNFQNFNEYQSSIKMAYIFDNTRNKMVNIRYGTRFKAFVEYYQEFLDKEQNNGNLSVVGFDGRHYQKISREIIWVNRLAGSSSFGKEKLIYYLGSIDNWLTFNRQTKFDYETDIDFSLPYRYQALAANLRGFPQNIRNGTSFALLNSELRIPVFKYLIQRPIKSSFIKNFQVVGFYDLGTAWNGTNPYEKENSSNKKEYTSGPVRVTTFSNIDPIVGGYGFGVRSTLLGYFVRCDWGWTIEDWYQSSKKPLFYLSLSKDI